MRKAFLNLLGAACVAWEVLEYLAFPAILVVIAHVLSSILGGFLEKWLEKSWADPPIPIRK